MINRVEVVTVCGKKVAGVTQSARHKANIISLSLVASFEMIRVFSISRFRMAPCLFPRNTRIIDILLIHASTTTETESCLNHGH